MNHSSPDSRANRILERWTAAITARAGWVIAFTALASIAAIVYAAGHLAINTDPSDMISAKLPFRQMAAQYRKLFPQYDDMLLVVVDAPTAEASRDGAKKLLSGLRARTDLFRDVYYPAGDPFLESHGLLYQEPAELNALADKITAAQPFLALLARDPSLAGLAGLLGKALEAAAHGQAMDLEPLLRRVNAGLEALSQNKPYSLSWQELMQGKDATLNDRRQLILAQPKLDNARLLPAEPAMNAIRELALSLSSLNENNPQSSIPHSAFRIPHSGLRVRVTGDVALSHDEMVSVFRGTWIAGLVSTIMVLVTLLIGLRSWRLTAFTLLVLIAGLALTGGFAALAIGHLNLISIAFAVLYIGLGVNYPIYLGISYRDALLRGRTPEEALRDCLQEAGLSLVMCALATAIAFYAFIPTSYAGVSELGLIAGTGMLISLLMSLTLLPALMHLWPLRRLKPRPAGGEGWFIHTMFHLTPRRRRALRLATTALAIASLALLTRVRFDDNPLNLRDPASESITTLDELIADATISPWSTIVLARGDAAARDLTARLGQLPAAGQVISVNEFIPQEQEKKLAVIEDLKMVLGPETFSPPSAPLPSPAAQTAALAELSEKLGRHLKTAAPATTATATLARLDQNLRALLATLSAAPAPQRQALLERLQTSLMGWLPATLESLRTVLGAAPAKLTDLPPALRDRWLSPGGVYRIEAFPKPGVDSDGIRRFVAQVRGVAPDATGDAVNILESGDAVVRSFQQAFAGAALAIALVMFFFMRRLKDVVLVLFPLLLAGMLTGAATVLLHISFNFASVIALPLLLGTSIENGIQMVQRMHRGAPPAGQAPGSAAARGILYCALTTIFSFGNLGFTAHRGLASMGQLLTIGMIFALLTNLFLLPAFLKQSVAPSNPPPPERARVREQVKV